MSILQKAWELRSVGTFTGVTGGAFVTSGRYEIPPGYGDTGGMQPGNGRWLPGMQWQSWGNSGPNGPEQAMKLSAVFACLRLLSEAISTLPLDTFQATGAGSQPYRPRPDYLNFNPPEISRITYLSQVMLSLLTDGNAFVATPRDELGVPITLLVLDPTQVQVVRNADNSISYLIGKQSFGPMDIMHISGMMLPGAVRGVSPLTAARDVIDGGQRAQEYGKNFIANDAMPPGVITMPDDGSAEAQAKARRIAQTWQETHGGTGNAGKIGVLIGGAELKTIAISPADAEWLDSKRFSVSEIARFYGVPPHLIADASNSTSWGTGLAEQNDAFGTFSLRPWTERIEEAHSRLLTLEGLPFVSVRLNMDSLLRPSKKERYDAYAIGIDNQWLTPNAVLKEEGLPPVPWGDDPVTVKGRLTKVPFDDAPVPTVASPGGSE